MDKGRKEYKYLWFIENYTWFYGTTKVGNLLKSPKFTINELEGTSWELILCPNGLGEKERGYVSLFLKRLENDVSPEDILVEFLLSLLAVDGSVLHSREFKYTFKSGDPTGSRQFFQTKEIHLQRKAEFLPQDNLSVCCKMWKGAGKALNIVQITARSRPKIEKISFFHVVESFSTLQPNEKHKIEIPSYYKEQCAVSSSIYFTPCSCGEIMIDILPSDADQTLLKCKISLIDVSGNIIDCGGVDYRYDAAKINTRKVSLSLKRDVILKRSKEYLPNDKLSLLCVCIFSAGFLIKMTEELLYELPLAVINCKRNRVHIKEDPEKFFEYPSVLENLKSIYKKQHLTDIELKTETKSFPAHKIVLCARSPVFEAMLTSDMKEKNTAYIRIDDMEDDTVEQLLLFLYSDSLEISEWKTATQLYYAADKYQIPKLKAMCFSFLAENLTISNASELLLLADTHNDSSLKKVVENFIMEHEKQVFGSKGWEKLIETNPTLVIKTMHLKFKARDEEN